MADYSEALFGVQSAATAWLKAVGPGDADDWTVVGTPRHRRQDGALSDESDDDSPLGLRVNPTRPADKPTRPPEPARVPTGTRGPCDFFTRYGRCREGAACRFSHNVAAAAAPLPPPSPVKASAAAAVVDPVSSKRTDPQNPAWSTHNLAAAAAPPSPAPPSPVKAPAAAGAAGHVSSKRTDPQNAAFYTAQGFSAEDAYDMASAKTKDNIARARVSKADGSTLTRADDAKPCKFGRSCAFGAKCRFSHGAPSTGTAPAIAAAGK